MIKICGNCKNYTFKGNPSNNGDCTKKGFGSYTPLKEACELFNERDL